MFLRTLALLLVCFSAHAQSPARVASLDWMAGSWVQDNGKEKVMETWLGPGNGLMAAVNLTTATNGGKSFEFLRIADTPDGISYIASPGGRPPVEFPVKELADKRVVFENPVHDFPQRVIYWREGELLCARIEGMLHGQARSEEWKFSRVSAGRG